MDIATALKTARTRKGLSQRALAERTGVAQAQISKIERGMVDLRLSSLVELARSLDLELMLIPRAAITPVTGLVRLAVGGSAAAKENGRALTPAYRLEEDEDGDA